MDPFRTGSMGTKVGPEGVGYMSQRKVIKITQFCGKSLTSSPMNSQYRRRTQKRYGYKLFIMSTVARSD